MFPPGPAAEIEHRLRCLAAEWQWNSTACLGIAGFVINRIIIKLTYSHKAPIYTNKLGRSKGGRNPILRSTDVRGKARLQDRLWQAAARPAVSEGPVGQPAGPAPQGHVSAADRGTERAGLCHDRRAPA